MSFAIAVQFQQVLLKATFILEVQVNLQQSIAWFKALQSCSEAAHRSMPAPAACWLKSALSSNLCLKQVACPLRSGNVLSSMEVRTRQSHLASQHRSDRGLSATSSTTPELAATHLVQLQRSASILNGVMRGLLDVNAQQVGCQEA